MPVLANSLKQIRQRSKSRIYPRPRPHLKQRLVALVLNLGFLRDRAITDFLAILNKNAPSSGEVQLNKSRICCQTLIIFIFRVVLTMVEKVVLL